MAELVSSQIKQTRPKLTIYDIITNHQLFSSIFFQLAFRCRIWKNYSVCICKSAGSISGLLLGQELVDAVVLGVFITYLTDTWKTDNILLKSITLVNSQKGLSATIVIITLFISDTKMGRLKPIAFLAAINIFGLVVLTLCSLIPVDGFGTWQIIAAICLATGKGIVEPGKKFISDQLRAHEPKNDIDENRIEARTKVWCLGYKFLSIALIFLIFDNLSSWPVIFTCSTFVIGIAYFFFLHGTHFYHCKEPTGSGSPLADIPSVVWAALFKRQNQIISRRHEDHQRFKDSKLLLTMLPLWIAFLGFGLALATADTLFPEQGNNLVPDISVVLLFVLRSLAGSIVSACYNFIVSKWVPKTKTKCCLLVRIWVGMLLSVFCFVVAWQVEVKRLKVIRDNGLLYKPKDTIPMSTFWLAPQFCILGFMERLAVDGLDDFFTTQVPEKSSLDNNYGSVFTKFFVGIGNLISVIFVHASGAWFGETLNLSRLDKYYMMMAIICFINMCFCSYVLTFYRQNLQGGEDQQAQTSHPNPLAVPPLNINIEIVHV